MLMPQAPLVSLTYAANRRLRLEEWVSGSRSNRSLAARRGHPYDKGRGFVSQALWVAVSTLIFTQVWCPNRLRCALLQWFGADVGQGVLIRHRVRVQWPWKLSIGDNSWVGTDAELYNVDNIIIGSDVCISQHVYICTGSHDRRSPTFEFDNGPIILEDGVWICARSTVLRGVTIGANSVISATSLVTSDVPPNSIVRPPPAIIGET
jgi:putative colanic acid biosynthesis acetyltransferase WcaF